MTLYFEEEGDVKLPLECEALAKRSKPAPDRKCTDS